jgi:hypothetical protein
MFPPFPQRRSGRSGRSGRLISPTIICPFFVTFSVFVMQFSGGGRLKNPEYFRIQLNLFQRQPVIDMTLSGLSISSDRSFNISTFYFSRLSE